MGAKGDCYNACVYHACVYLLKKYEGKNVGKYKSMTKTEVNNIYHEIAFRDKKDDILTYARKELESGRACVPVKEVVEKFFCSEKSVRMLLVENDIPCQCKKQEKP